MIGFRADANSEIGYGHVMRLISIATQCINLGEEVIFYTAEESAENVLIDNQIPYEIIDFNKTEFKDDVLVVDSYKVSENYFLDIKEKNPNIKIVYIDDLFEVAYPVDMVINSNIYANDMDYDSKYPKLEEKGTLLLGPIYAPLREQFVEISRREFATECDNILLTVGGGDQLGMLVKFVERINNCKELKNVDFHVIVGGLPQNQDKLVELAKDTRNVFIHRDVSNMAGLMRSCDLAVSAAGTTLLELASLGVPTICFTVADNQKYDGEYFAKNKQMTFVGDATKNVEEVITNTIENIKELVDNRKLRKDMAKACSTITDGQGALRIAKAIIELK